MVKTFFCYSHNVLFFKPLLALGVYKWQAI